MASFVNPHDIAFSGFGWEQLLKFGPPDDSVPEIPEPPSQSDPFAGRPACQEAFKAVWPQMIFETATDLGYRRLYYYLHKLVDQAIGTHPRLRSSAAAWRTTPSSCSPRTTATCWGHTAA